MTIILTPLECRELCDEALHNSPRNISSPFELFYEVPKQLGKGYVRDIEVSPNLQLSIFNCEFHDDIVIQIPVWNHPLQFDVFLSGVVRADYGQVGEGYTLISGGGVQRKMLIEHPKSIKHVGVSIHMPPEFLGAFFLTMEKFLINYVFWQRAMIGKHYYTLKSLLLYKG